MRRRRDGVACVIFNMFTQMLEICRQVAIQFFRIAELRVRKMLIRVPTHELEVRGAGSRLPDYFVSRVVSSMGASPLVRCCFDGRNARCLSAFICLPKECRLLRRQAQRICEDSSSERQVLGGQLEEPELEPKSG